MAQYLTGSTQAFNRCPVRARLELWRNLPRPILGCDGDAVGSHPLAKIPPPQILLDLFDRVFLELVQQHRVVGKDSLVHHADDVVLSMRHGESSLHQPRRRMEVAQHVIGGVLLQVHMDVPRNTTRVVLRPFLQSECDYNER